MKTLLPIIALVAALLGGCPTENTTSDATDAPDANILYMFHNNRGSMCLEALEWLPESQAANPALVVEEHLTYESGEAALLSSYAAQFGSSQGVSTSFEYLPIIFYQGQAFSGFDEDIAAALEALLAATESAT